MSLNVPILAVSYIATLSILAKVLNLGHWVFPKALSKRFLMICSSELIIKIQTRFSWYLHPGLSLMNLRFQFYSSERLRLVQCLHIDYMLPPSEFARFKWRISYLIIVSTPLAAGGLVIFGNFSLGEGWEFFGIQGGYPLKGGLQNLGGAETFHKFVRR